MKKKPLDGPEIERLYTEEFMSIEDIGLRFGVSRTPVFRILSERSVPIRRTGATTSPKKKAEIIRLRKETDMNCWEIESATDVCHRVVRRVLKEAGFALRPGPVAPLKGMDAPAWKGGRRIVRHGYVEVYCPEHPMAKKNGYALEHRKVASDAAGRPLTEDEEVHHINGVKSDNTPENLLVVKSGKHQQLHADHRREVWELRKRIETLESQLNPGQSLKVYG
jgi:hypothetical protein